MRHWLQWTITVTTSPYKKRWPQSDLKMKTKNQVNYSTSLQRCWLSVYSGFYCGWQRFPFIWGPHLLNCACSESICKSEHVSHVAEMNQHQTRDRLHRAALLIIQPGISSTTSFSLKSIGWNLIWKHSVWLKCSKCFCQLNLNVSSYVQSFSCLKTDRK